MGLNQQIEFDRKLSEARKRVEAMDEIDGYEERDIRTIYFALECGLRNKETGADF